MRMTTTGLMATAALIGLAACSKKTKPADLPPPPPQQGPGNGAGPGEAMPPSGQSGIRPGSRADMIASAGTDTVHFATDSSDVDSEARGTLTGQATWLKRNVSVRVTVEGHCDERGTREYNLALGERRATAAKNFLVAAGVPATRITVLSYGKERSLGQGAGESAWAADRRAVTVVPE